MQIIKEVVASARRATPIELRKFGFVFSGILVVLFFLVIPWLKHRSHGSWNLLMFGMALATMAQLAPVLLRPVFLLASIVGAVLGAINNRIILSLVFFLILWPLAVMMRWVSGADPMRRTLEKQAETYRISCAGKDLGKNKEKTF
jgi:hypothetical protein